jgi:putative addiction module component (TIGR02574 family)
MSIAEIKKMSTIERLQTMEQLWDVLCNEEGELSSPDWHQGELSKRSARVDAGAAKFHSLDELKAMLRR